MNKADRNYEQYKQLLDLWAKANPIKTNKLQILLLANALLLTAVNVSGGFTAENWPIYVGGAILSFVWVLSIGRTSLFQKIWQIKINELAKNYPKDERFQILNKTKIYRKTPLLLRIFGGVSSKYYLLGAPLVFCIIWLCLLLYFLSV